MLTSIFCQYKVYAASLMLQHKLLYNIIVHCVVLHVLNIILGLNLKYSFY